MDNEAECRYLEVVKLLHSISTEGCTQAAMHYAAMNGHLDVVKWPYENRAESCFTRAMDETDSLEILQWLHEHRSAG